jgi:L-asparagine transporter-like permease
LWIVAYAAVLLAINLRQVGDYGRFEYWFAMVKVATIVLFIIVGAALLFGGRVEAQYTAAGGFLPHGALGPIKAISFALFSFLGVEMVAISSGEARGSREIARATRIMFTLLAFVYVGAIAILVGVMPWQAAGVRQSPFVTVFEVAGIPAASTLMNAVVLSAALSGANASLYVASRMLFSLARGGYAPAALGRLTGAGSPRNAVAVSATGILVAVAAQRFAPEAAYLYIIGASLFGGVLAWWVALAAHVRFRSRLSSEEVARLPMRSPGGALASQLGFVVLALAIASTWWVDQSRITIVSGGPYLLVLTAAYLAVQRAGRRKTES